MVSETHNNRSENYRSTFIELARPAQFHTDVDANTLNDVITRNPELGMPIGGDETAIRKMFETAGKQQRDDAQRQEWRFPNGIPIRPDIDPEPDPCDWCGHGPYDTCRCNVA